MYQQLEKTAFSPWLGLLFLTEKKKKKAAYLLRNLMGMLYCTVPCILGFGYTFCFPDVSLFLYAKLQQQFSPDFMLPCVGY